jgi:hypothetical protein
MATTHFSGPVLLSGKGDLRTFKDLPVGVNTDYTVLFDDFTGVAIDLTNDWTEVKDTGASVAIAADEIGGRVALTSAATTDNDGASIQGNEIFRVATDRFIWFETKFQCNDADQTDLCFGMTVNFATNPEAMLTAADRIVFQVNDGDASILCKTEKNGTETSTDSGVDLEDATDIRLGFRVESTGVVYFYINQSLVATHTTNIPDDENLTVAAMSVSGSASGTRATSIDYILGAQSR